MMTGVRSERGMVLLVVLLVIALLATLLTEFSFSTLVDLRLAETFRDSTRGFYLARGGVTVGRMLLKQDTNGYDAPNELWSQGLVNFPVGGGYLSVSGEDLSSRLNLNLLIDNQGNVDVVSMERFTILCELLGAEDPDLLTDSLIDWLDADNDPRPLGGEDNYYLSRANPYPTGNGPLASLEELSLVRGFDATILERLTPHVTLYGTTSVNVNTASREVLTAVMAAGGTVSLAEAEIAADRILELREEGPIEDKQALKGLADLENLDYVINTFLDVSSHAFRIRSEAEVNDGRRTMTAVVDERDRLLEQKVD